MLGGGLVGSVRDEDAIVQGDIIHGLAKSS